MSQSSTTDTIGRGPPLFRHRPWQHPVILGGLLLLAAGIALDLGHHAGIALAADEDIARAGHLITLLGMLIILAGLLLARRHR